MTRTSRTTTTSSGFFLLPIGIALTSVAPALHGWWHGLLLGMGLALLVSSAVLMGATIGTRRSEGQGWLPSRDGDG
jgi:uncharacterized protein (DUF58 family)